MRNSFRLKDHYFYLAQEPLLHNIILLIQSVSSSSLSTNQRSRTFPSSSISKMYLRDAHKDLDLHNLYKFIRENPLGVLTTAIKQPSYPLLQSSHIPWVLDIPEGSTTADGSIKAVFRGHLALANPHTKALLAVVAETQKEACSDEYNGTWIEDDVMVLFTSSVTHYVTPKFYVETKPSTGKVVPTWNYAAVQAYGKMRIYADGSAEQSKAFLAKQLDDLSKLCEEEVMGYDGKEGRKEPWGVHESPENYTNLLKKAIVGVEIEIHTLQGKWKMSQELSEGDREGTITGFEALGSGIGSDMAALVKERGCMKNAQKKASK
jgi:transcriptional regulator